MTDFIVSPLLIGQRRADEMATLHISAFNRRHWPIYVVIRLERPKVDELRGRLAGDEPFAPSEFGEVLAAGVMQPPPDLRREIAARAGGALADLGKMTSAPVPRGLTRRYAVLPPLELLTDSSDERAP